MEARERKTEPEEIVTDPRRALSDRGSVPVRSAAAKRRSMQAALAAAVIALRSPDHRRVGWRPPPGGLR